MSSSKSVQQPSLIVRAAHKKQGAELPVWFMRQAGRSLPEYRETRVGTAMLESCFKPEMVAEITMQPVRRHNVDAAIFFSDIMVPLKAAGIDLDIVAGTGPVVANPIRSLDDVTALPELDPQALAPIAEAVRLVREELADEKALIGFAGAPFTLASYLIEGGPSKDHAKTKAFMVAEPETWHALCARLGAMSLRFLETQIEAGAEIVQLFDSWAGSLAEDDYRTFVLPHSRAIFEGLRHSRPEADFPTIHFGVGTGEILGAMTEAGATVTGVDWRVPLDVAAQRIGGRNPVQGNLDPSLLQAPWPILAERVREIIRRGATAPGHIFNLGHGVPPSTDPGVLTRIVELIHTEAPQLRQAAGHN